MFIETLPQVNFDYSSEKDMIGSLLDGRFFHYTSNR